MMHGASCAWILLLGCAFSDAASARDWPMPRVPAEVNLSLVGESMQMDGMPMRIYQFATRRNVESVIELFSSSVQGAPKRMQLAGPDGPITVAGRSGNYWLTVQLRATPHGTSGTWAATPQFEERAQKRIFRPVGFPATAQLLQQVDSVDAGKRSQLVIGVDPASIDAVALRLEQEMRLAGYTKQPFIERHWVDSNRYVAMFGRAREEVMVTLLREQQGTSITMNRLTALEVLE
jgi:hypothetical protein